LEKAIEIKRRAQRCVQNGDLDGALREYEKLVETPESDPYNFVLLADLLYKKGDQIHAAERYLHAVSAYEKAGLFKNAIAVCKKMMRLSLSQTQVLRHLAELHALDGLISEASIYFTQYAEHMVRANNPTEAVAALRKAFDNGQENVKLLEQMSEMLFLEGETAKAAVAMREAAGHWHTRGRQPDARRCVERANRMDPATSTPLSGGDSGASIPRLVLPGTPPGAAPAANPSAANPAAANPPAANPPALDAPPEYGFTPDLPLEARSVALEPTGSAPTPPDLRSPFADAPPTPASGQFERAPRFVAPPRPASGTHAMPPAAAPAEAAEVEEAAPEAGVYEIAAEEDTSYERALDAAATAPPVPSPFPPVPGGPPPSTLAPHSDGMLDGVTLVEHLLQRAQDEFRAGERDKASLALVQAAITYESLGRLDSAATIFRSLGRGAHSPLEVMTLWLANCEKRNDRTEGSQVACELGDRALNDGQETQARTWFEHAAAIDPTNETARRRIQRMNGAASRSMPAPTIGAAPAAETGRVEVALGRSQAVTFDLGGLLEEFQRGVESQLDGDTQGHYDLGMAYREMGLQDQAVEAFHIAVRDPRLAGRAHEMIGRCHADTGAHDAAVQEFTEALGHGTLDGPGEAELRLQLGMSLAALGDFTSAARQLEIADKRCPGRSDVAERLAEWRRRFGKAA
jgi:tetratricopeptide (TPR) repeat protein